MQKTIYHYTSGDALKSIVENKKLWFSDIRCMNDYGEQQLFLKAVLKKVTIEPFKEMFKPEIYEQYEDFMWRRLELAMNQTRCFVLSCSNNCDSLPMWNYYSKGCLSGGYNLGLNPTIIAKHINETVIDKNKLNEAVLFGNVSYCKTDDIICDCLENIFKFYINIMFSSDNSMLINFGHKIEDTLFDDINESVEDEFKLDSFEDKTRYIELMNEFLDDCKAIDITKNKIFAHFIKNNKVQKDYFNIYNFIKSADFSYEKENRIIVLVPQDKIAELKERGIYKTRYNNGIYIPYLDIKIPQESFVSAKIAPTNFTMEPEKNLKEFLLDNEIDINVDKSKITVRY